MHEKNLENAPGHIIHIKRRRSAANNFLAPIMKDLSGPIRQRQIDSTNQ